MQKFLVLYAADVNCSALFNDWSLRNAVVTRYVIPFSVPYLLLNVMSEKKETGISVSQGNFVCIISLIKLPFLFRKSRCCSFMLFNSSLLSLSYWRQGVSVLSGVFSGRSVFGIRSVHSFQVALLAAWRSLTDLECVLLDKSKGQNDIILSSFKL